MPEGRALKAAPSFDGRAVCYPSAAIMRDYLSWRQVDCHINNQYNTCYWLLVLKGGCSPAEAQKKLKGTQAGFKNELLFKEFGVNYNELPQEYRKGTCLFREEELDADVAGASAADGAGRRGRLHVVEAHEDIIKDAFWERHPSILRH
eukprot:TRINITY_DN33516_c0_g1_i2.p2 TRINITY_DN33516_c0_g1~~TRINITY_DN33516_c0_g1_i2.p2  ORF type:complete len:148 (+),score=40.86 TRINITY_DN33516_c0_g1_i2:576-1019(+)